MVIEDNEKDTEKDTEKEFDSGILKELEKIKNETNKFISKDSSNLPIHKKVTIKRKTIIVQKFNSNEIKDSINKSNLNNKNIYNTINKDNKNIQSHTSSLLNEEKIFINNFKSHFALSRPGKNELGNTKTNQDSYIVLTRINNLKDFNIFGVLDGHGPEGHLVSQFVSKYLQIEFQTNPSIEKSKDVETIYSTLSHNNFEIIKEIFINGDNALRDQEIDSRSSGTTCVLVIHLGEHIICANAGDSRAVLVFDEKNDEKLNFLRVFPLSIDSKPENPGEKERILKCGGNVEKILNKYGQPVGPYRVWVKNKDYPGLAMSRSIGDFNGKSVGVIPNPEIIECNLSIYSKYIVICSDGVWEFLNNEEVMNIGKNYYLSNNPRGFCKEVIECSVKIWEKEDIVIDDITMVAVFF